MELFGNGMKLPNLKNILQVNKKTNQSPQLDPTTPWYEWISYCECCESLGVINQPRIGRFMAYRRYLKEVGVIK